MLHALMVLAQSESILSQYYTTLLVLAIIFGLYMAWSIGANDVANAMGTSVGSGALTLRRAIILAAILEFAGAFFVGQHVTGAVRGEIVPPEAFSGMATEYVFGMLAALLAAAVWLMVATYYGWPVSTTHTIVGAILGFGLVALDDWTQIQWAKVGQIVSSWLVSPLLAGTIAFLVFTVIQHRVLYRRDLVRASQRTAPFFVFAVFFTITLVTLWKGLKPLGLDFGLWEALGLASLISLAAAVFSIPLLGRVSLPEEEVSQDSGAQNPMVDDELERLEKRTAKLSSVATGGVQEAIERIQDQLAAVRSSIADHTPRSPGWATPELRSVEKVFVYLQILSACSVAFAHGANDVANAVGPVSGIIHVLQHDSVAALKTEVDPSLGLGILAVGGIGIVVGLATWGRRVIETVGRRITELTPTRGFSAEFGAAVTILLASRFKLPISTTHTLVGAVFGVGLARGVSALNLRVVLDIVISWIVTVPAGAILAIFFYNVLKAAF